MAELPDPASRSAIWVIAERLHIPMSRFTGITLEKTAGRRRQLRTGELVTIEADQVFKAHWASTGCRPVGGGFGRVWKTAVSRHDQRAQSAPEGSGLVAIASPVAKPDVPSVEEWQGCR